MTEIVLELPEWLKDIVLPILKKRMVEHKGSRNVRKKIIYSISRQPNRW